MVLNCMHLNIIALHWMMIIMFYRAGRTWDRSLSLNGGSLTLPLNLYKFWNSKLELLIMLQIFYGLSFEYLIIMLHKLDELSLRHAVFF